MIPETLGEFRLGEKQRTLFLKKFKVKLLPGRDSSLAVAWKRLVSSRYAWKDVSPSGGLSETPRAEVVCLTVRFGIVQEQGDECSPPALWCYDGNLRLLILAIPSNLRLVCCTKYLLGFKEGRRIAAQFRRQYVFKGKI
ncbi:hypothetical protein DPMN_174573 [Dreissena polymorpha]|uniref:Uncharacterized protein n=1 Tax=Dreissena polymorpha TaxID=45954 RepID=A0A9D4E6J7_DREPO|nr:hypothetical protein DPMN_174573 [Dreissena polymorpha]